MFASFGSVSLISGVTSSNASSAVTISQSVSANASGERERWPPSGKNCLAQASMSISSPCSARRSASGKPAAPARMRAAPALMEPKCRSTSSLCASIKSRACRATERISAPRFSGAPTSNAGRPQHNHANKRSAVSSGSHARSSHSPCSSTHASTISAMRRCADGPTAARSTSQLNACKRALKCRDGCAGNQGKACSPCRRSAAMRQTPRPISRPRSASPTRGSLPKRSMRSGPAPPSRAR